MLPSTGYFKTINCPFYENGSCERPYCHFKHSKREDVGNTSGTTGTTESRTTGPPQESKNSAIPSADSDVLQQLVTEAVKKVLADREVTGSDKFPENVVSQVVEGLKPALTPGSSAAVETVTSNAIGSVLDVPPAIKKPVPCVYNPTPIAELKKRHIPIISYMPTRESRVSVKRKFASEETKPWLSIVREPTESPDTQVRYKPTAIVNNEDRDSLQSYVPTCKSNSVSSNSYDDSNDYLLNIREEYYPKSKKRREEYVPKSVKPQLKIVGQLNQSTLNQFEPSFDIIDQFITSSQTGPRQTSSENSRDSAYDFESKFSDDDDDDSNNANKQKNGESAVEELSVKRNDFDRVAKITNDVETKQNLKNKQIDARDEPASSADPLEEESINDNIGICNEIKSPNAIDGKALDSRKDTKHIKKEDKSKDKTHNGDRKSTRRSSKDSHKRSSGSHSREKGKSRGSKDSKTRKEEHSVSDKDREKDKHKYKHKSKEQEKSKDKRRDKKDKKDKTDDRKSDKRHGHDSRKSSKSSKKDDRDKERTRDERNHSRSRRKSDTGSSGKSNKLEETSNERHQLSERSVSLLENLDFFLDDETDHDAMLSLSDSDHDVQEECLKIFQEYQVTERPKETSSKEQPKDELQCNEEVGRKRVAHPSAAMNVTRTQLPNQPAKKNSNPQLKMYERWRLMRDAAAKKTIEKVTEKPVEKVSIEKKSASVESAVAACHNEAQCNGNGRIRIAHVPYARSLAMEMEKRKVSEKASVGKQSGDSKLTDSKTTAQTAKSGVRVAHVPQAVPQLIRPEPLQVTTQKFPLNVRQYYVNIMHDVCVQIYTNAEDAAQRAVKEEFACHERCKALAVYKNSCMLATHRLRKEVDQNTTTDGTHAPSASSMVSHEAMLAGKSKGSWSVLKTKKAVTNFKGAVLYGMLKKWIMSEQQLCDNGFPRPHPEGQKGRAKVYVTNSRNQSVLSKVPNERICCRCGQAYMIDKQGLALRQQNCIYHWGRKFTIRGEGKYSCCQQYGAATGCCDAKTHVWDYTDYENLRGYVKTLPKDTTAEEQGVYALDCEMSYTSQGLELTRVTVIDEDCNVIYESLVKPQNPIIDYNTRFSGITEENMKNVTTTLLDVQAALLTMFSDKTILVGHSLESDFKALKLLHDTVVDTSIMFPHKNGYPQKRALRNLCSEYLRKIIQNDVGGHDSKEDAVSCMELILWKAKEEAKLQ